jgi:hypothetical protein
VSNKSILSQLNSPEFSKRFQEEIEQDRQAGMEWRSKIVRQANANAALEGLQPDAQMLEMQRQFITGELDINTMLMMVRELAEKAGETLKSHGIE